MQSPPEDLMQHPGHLLRRAVQVMNLLWDEEVSHTITSPQFAALNALYTEPNLDQRTLGQRISLDRSTMAEVVSRLCDRGLIRTERDRRDGRRKTIALTTKGLHTVQHLIPRTHVMTDRLVGCSPRSSAPTRGARDPRAPAVAGNSCSQNT